MVLESIPDSGVKVSLVIQKTSIYLTPQSYDTQWWCCICMRVTIIFHVR